MSRYALLGPESWRHLGYRRVSNEVAVVIVEHRPRGEMHERAGRSRAQVVAVIISSKWLPIIDNPFPPHKLVVANTGQK